MRLQTCPVGGIGLAGGMSPIEARSLRRSGPRVEGLLRACPRQEAAARRRHLRESGAPRRLALNGQAAGFRRVLSDR